MRREANRRLTRRRAGNLNRQHRLKAGALAPVEGHRALLAPGTIGGLDRVQPVVGGSLESVKPTAASLHGSTDSMQRSIRSMAALQV
jgi:predicted dinucleotide-utilizing enzyme